MGGEIASVLIDLRQFQVGDSVPGGNLLETIPHLKTPAGAQAARSTRLRACSAATALANGMSVVPARSTSSTLLDSGILQVAVFLSTENRAQARSATDRIASNRHVHPL
jgi:hypothetical protein